MQSECCTSSVSVTLFHSQVKNVYSPSFCWWFSPTMLIRVDDDKIPSELFCIIYTHTAHRYTAFIVCVSEGASIWLVKLENMYVTALKIYSLALLSTLIRKCKSEEPAVPELLYINSNMKTKIVFVVSISNVYPFTFSFCSCNIFHE